MNHSITEIETWLEVMSDGTLPLDADNSDLARSTLELVLGRVPSAPVVPVPPVSVTAVTISPAQLLFDAVDPALYYLASQGVQSDDRARVLLMAIAGQESNWSYRTQVGGPARSFWQFEKGGGVAQVFMHALAPLNAICSALAIPCNETTVFEAMAWNDRLAAAMARLNLWCDPRPLPEVGQEQDAWDFYLSVWRPGAPHPDQWPSVYSKALSLI